MLDLCPPSQPLPPSSAANTALRIQPVLLVRAQNRASAQGVNLPLWLES